MLFSRIIIIRKLASKSSLVCHFAKMSPDEVSSLEKIVLKPPSFVRGMTILDRNKFQTDVKIPCISVPADKMAKALKILKPHVLKQPKLQPVIKETPNKPKILFNPRKYEENKTYLDKVFENLNLGKMEWSTVQLKYDNWTSDDVFRAVLPEDSVGNVSSFSIVGHIIHLNLKPELLDFKFLIGQVLLDKYQPNIKTVVNKSDIIDNTFRNFKMEHLAGEENYQVLVKENNFQFAFNYEKVFWNPRLNAEHERMAKKVSSEDLVFDVFAGVGPFAVPMAKKECTVHANDLNPDSYHWLCHNAKLNKVQTHLKAYNMDGKDFILNVIKPEILGYFNSDREEAGNIHILMNLPALGLTFLQYFNGLFVGESEDTVKKMPVVHCYFFKRKDEKSEDVLSFYLDERILNESEITVVRVVAPNKLMMKITYRIPEDILFGDDNTSCEPSSKRTKLSVEEESETLHSAEKIHAS